MSDIAFAHVTDPVLQRILLEVSEFKGKLDRMTLDLLRQMGSLVTSEEGIPDEELKSIARTWVLAGEIATLDLRSQNLIRGLVRHLREEGGIPP